jgi:hypothetical protein
MSALAQVASNSNFPRVAPFSWLFCFFFVCFGWGSGGFSDFLHHLLVHFVDKIETYSFSKMNQKRCVKWDFIAV